jgi:uncharacterized membrane-anchored protein
LLAVFAEGEEAAVRQHALKIAGALPDECQASPNHLSASLPGFDFTWECHTEFATYSFIRRGTDNEIENWASDFPQRWMVDLPASILRGTQIRFLSTSDPEPEPETLLEEFNQGDLVSCDVFDGGARIWTDFRLHTDGFGKLLVKDRGLVGGEATRLIQWLQELGNYRKMALLGLPLARRLGTRLKGLEGDFAELIDMISLPERQTDAELFRQLSRSSAELNMLETEASFRMSATRAYAQLVFDRLASLRESRVAGYPTLSEFTERRFMPALRTCESFSDRTQQVSRRADSASALMRTRIDVDLRGQTRDLLASMDHRATLQLRLQQAVEGLSVAAITYYLVALLNYELKAMHPLLPRVDPTIALGVAIPLIFAAIWHVIHSKGRSLR